MKEIQLSQGKVAKVSDHRFDYLNQWKWYAKESGKGRWYAVRLDKKNMVRMHRFITNCPDDMQVDHIDNDGLNNQDENLRTCTQSQNQANRRVTNKNKTSKYKGVCRRKYWWQAYIGEKHLGIFETEKEAAEAYNKAALEKYGEFAKLNVW